MYKNFPSIAEAFLNYFDVDLVTSATQMEQVARLRYRVYCEEFGYEQAEAFPGRQETDAFDDYSLHCLVTHKRRQLPAGCVRLICASDDHALPIETHCQQSIYLDYLNDYMSDRETLCEVSRLAVDSAFRRRVGEKQTRVGDFNAIDCCHLERRTFSLIAVAAIMAGFAMSSLTGRDHIFTMMESNLPRLLRRAGIPVSRAGDTMEYHGQRSAYFISTEASLAQMGQSVLALYETIYQRLVYQYHAQAEVEAAYA